MIILCKQAQPSPWQRLGEWYSCSTPSHFDILSSAMSKSTWDRVSAQIQSDLEPQSKHSPGLPVSFLVITWAHVGRGYFTEWGSPISSLYALWNNKCNLLNIIPCRNKLSNLSRHDVCLAYLMKTEQMQSVCFLSVLSKEGLLQEHIFFRLKRVLMFVSHESLQYVDCFLVFGIYKSNIQQTYPSRKGSHGWEFRKAEGRTNETCYFSAQQYLTLLYKVN